MHKRNNNIIKYAMTHFEQLPTEEVLRKTLILVSVSDETYNYDNYL